MRRSRRADQICYPCIRTFGFLERRVLVPQAVGCFAVQIYTVNVNMKNSVPWKRIHSGGTLD